LPSMRIRRQSPDSAPWATMRLMAEDLPPPGSPPMSMLRSASSTCACSPNSSMPTWTGWKMDSGNTGTAAGGISVAVMMVASFRAGDRGRSPEVAPGTLPWGLCGLVCWVGVAGDGWLRPGGRAVVAGHCVEHGLAIEHVGVDSRQPGERGTDLVA